jgi:hypothetical protein
MAQSFTFLILVLSVPFEPLARLPHRSSPNNVKIKAYLQWQMPSVQGLTN